MNAFMEGCGVTKIALGNILIMGVVIDVLRHFQRMKLLLFVDNFMR